MSAASKHGTHERGDGRERARASGDATGRTGTTGSTRVWSASRNVERGGHGRRGGEPRLGVARHGLLDHARETRVDLGPRVDQWTMGPFVDRVSHRDGHVAGERLGAARAS